MHGSLEFGGAPALNAARTVDELAVMLWLGDVHDAHGITAVAIAATNSGQPCCEKTTLGRMLA